MTAAAGRGPSRAGGLALSLAFVAMFASAPGQSFLIAVFLDDMVADTHVSRTGFSLLYGVATIVSATMSLWLGRGADRFGLRAAWAVVAVGLAGACALASVAGGVISVLVALSLLRAFGQGSFPLLGTLIANYWFPRRPGAAMSVARFGITAATIALPPLVALLVVEVGWRSAYRIVAAVVLLCILPLAALLRSPPAPAATQANDALPAVPPLAASRRSRRLRIRIPRREAGLLLFVSSAAPLVMTALTFHAVSLLGERGLSAPAAALALSVFGVASAVATIALGPLSDRLTTRALLATTSSLLLLATAILFVRAPLASYGSFAVLGLAGAFSGVTTGIVWSRTYGLTRLGRLQGVSFAAQITAAAAGPLPLAVSFQATGSYTLGLVILGLVSVSTLLAATRWREPAGRAAVPHGSAERREAGS